MKYITPIKSYQDLIKMFIDLGLSKVWMCGKFMEVHGSDEQLLDLKNDLNQDGFKDVTSPIIECEGYLLIDVSKKKYTWMDYGECFYTLDDLSESQHMEIESIIYENFQVERSFYE